MARLKVSKPALTSHLHGEPDLVSPEHPPNGNSSLPDRCGPASVLEDAAPPMPERIGDVPLEAHGDAEKGGAGWAISGNRSGQLAEKIKELVRLAQEQGYLTYSDITEALPEALITPEDLDEIYIKLRNLEVEIVDQAEV